MPEKENAARHYGKISKKQREILDFVKNRIATSGCPPTVREICVGVGLKSTSSVHSHLNTLEKNGYIRHEASKGRAIEVADENFSRSVRETVSVPAYGLDALSGGLPDGGERPAAEYFPLPKGRIGGDAEGVFIVKAPDASMAGMGIPEGCLVIARRTDSAVPGNIVVVSAGGRAAIRMYAEDGSGACLLSKGAGGGGQGKMDKEKRGKDFRILGEAIGLMNFFFAGLPVGEEEED